METQTVEFNSKKQRLFIYNVQLNKASNTLHIISNGNITLKAIGEVSMTGNGDLHPVIIYPDACEEITFNFIHSIDDNIPDGYFFKSQTASLLLTTQKLKCR